MCDIICTTDDITSTLSHQITVFMMSHTLQAWHHTHCITHRTHCIFVITTSPLIPSPLLYDIIPTLCETSYALYRTIYQLLMSSHYHTYDIRVSIYETTSSIMATYTLYMWHHRHLSVSSLSLYWQHHTHSVWHHTRIMYGIFCTIQNITSMLYDIKPPFYDITPTIFDIISTVSVSSHPIYWWYHTNWIFEISSAL